MYNESEKIVECFRRLQENVASPEKTSICLEYYAKKITGIDIPVTIQDLEYPDIFNHVNVTVKNGKLVLENLGIFIDTDIIGKHTPEELAAAFLYEIGLYEELIKHPELKYWIVLGLGSPLIAPVITIATKIIDKYLGTNTENKLRKYTELLFALIFISYVISLISHVKSSNISKTAPKYVVKYQMTKEFKSFLTKHERPITLYLYNLEKFVPLTGVIRQLAVVFKKIANVVAYGVTDEHIGILCRTYELEVKAVTNLKGYSKDYINEILEDYKKFCKGTISIDVLESKIQYLEDVIQLAKKKRGLI